MLIVVLILSLLDFNMSKDPLSGKKSKRNDKIV